MISMIEYFGTKVGHDDCTPIRRANAGTLLARVNALLADAFDEGAYKWELDPDTGTCVSGSRGGAGDGGFRLSTSTTGRPGSAHKEGEAVDVYDPENKLDDWLDSFDEDAEGRFNSMLEKHDLYREKGEATPGWAHLQIRAPGSGKRTYVP